MKAVALTLLLLSFCLVSRVFAQTLKVSTFDGGSVTTDLGYNIKVNKNSSLHRTWVNLNDDACPMQISNAGIVTRHEEREYVYRPVGSAQINEDIAGFQLRFLLYDAFGNHIQTLSDVVLEDITANKSYDLKNIGSWRGWEDEVRSLVTVVAVVAYVRTQNGKVWQYNADAVVKELSKIRLRAVTGDLEPEPTKKN